MAVQITASLALLYIVVVIKNSDYKVSAVQCSVVQTKIQIQIQIQIQTIRTTVQCFIAMCFSLETHYTHHWNFSINSSEEPTYVSELHIHTNNFPNVPVSMLVILC